MRYLFLTILVLLLIAPAAAQQQLCTPGDYVTGGTTANTVINFRASPALNAPILAKLTIDTPITVLGAEEGTAFRGSTVWCHATVNQVEGYLHSAFVVSPDAVVPADSAINNPAVPTSTPVPLSLPVPTPTSRPPVASGASCPNLSATCSALTCNQAYACLRAGNGRLDRDNDGIPCESVCGG